MMSKSTAKLLIALAAAAGAIYLLNKTATNVKKSLDERTPQFSDTLPVDFQPMPTIDIQYPSGVILS